MTTNEELGALRAANTRLREALSADLSRLWSSLDLGDRDGVRAVVLDVSPALVDEYGQMGSAVSAEFFEDAVGAVPVLGDGLNPEQVGESARWAIGPLWEDNPDTALSQLTASLTRHALSFGRETVHLSTVNARGVTYARVPGDLCPFCTELASRGPVFGRTRSDEALHFHDGCTCELVPSRTPDDLPPEYNPSALRDLYAQMKADGRA